MLRSPACLWFLAAFLLFANAAPVADQLSKWQPGKRIQVVFLNGEKAVGRLGSVGPDRFTLNPDPRSKSAPREIPFAEVRSVKSKLTTAEKWIVGGAIYAGVTGFVAATLGR